MNETIQNFAKEELKELLKKCTEKEQHLFKRMYANKRLELSIDEVVDKMDESKLDLAFTQVERTLAKKIRGD